MTVDDEDSAIFSVEYGDGPVIAVALHDGHVLRPELEAIARVSDSERLHEEDPFTAAWTGLGDTRVRVLRSRFEVDMNRPRDQAVYAAPRDAWGLDVWEGEGPSAEMIDASLRAYDMFYATMRTAIEATISGFGMFVVYDLHSYNGRRPGVAVDPRDNPVINLGTGSLDRTRWGAVPDRFLRDVAGFEIGAGPVDARENVRFRGGHFTRWVNETFWRHGCALAIEVKKVFMDEHTGVPDWPLLREVGLALASTVPGVVEEIRDGLREAA